MRRYASFVLLFLFGTLATAAARWKPDYVSADPKIQAWYHDQHNDKGEWCCDESDGHPFYGAYVLNKDGSVTLVTEKGLHSIPSYKVLKGPNPTGHAVWWFDSNRDYCFAPGTLG